MNSHNNINYFLNSYKKEINGGGTFSLIELYELFVQFEPSSIVQKFHEELEELILELNKEDWELSKHTQVLCNEYGRRRLKEMIMKLQVHKER